MVIVSTIIHLALLSIGLQMIFVGRRGRRVDDHPLCRRCGFDLVGRPDTSTQCPECGADLTPARAIRVGHRVARRGLIIAGVIAMLLPVASFVAMGMKVDPQKMKPTWWLMLETRSVSASSASWRELSRRALANELSNNTVNRLTDRVLSRQADAKQPWQGEWGDFVETGYATKYVAEDRWQRYLREAAKSSLEVRQLVRRADRLPVKAIFGSRRGGTKLNLSLHVSNPVFSGELLVPMSGVMDWSGSLAHGPPDHETSIQLDSTARTATLGPREITYSYDLQIRQGRPARVHAAWTETFHGTWTLVDENTETVKLVDDAAMREAVAKSITVKGVAWNPYDSRAIAINLDVRRPPAPFAFEVAATSNGRRWRMYPLITDVAGPAGTGTPRGIEGPLPTKIDLHFRPSADLARTTTNITRIWNGEIVIKDVTIPPPATTQSDGPR